MKTIISAAGASDVGRKRNNNQDQFLIAEIAQALRLGANGLGIEPTSHVIGAPIAYLMIVADGMGGHQGGSRASELAVREIASRITGLLSWFPGSVDLFTSNLETSIKSIVEEAHFSIIDESENDEKRHGMGTTLTMAIVVEQEVLVAHVGDSRCYLVRDGSIERLTEDHTVANQIAARGGVSLEEAENSPWSNVLWNALGADADAVRTDIRRLEIKVGDRFILCSDGLNKHVSDADILKIVNATQDLNQACEFLLKAANQAGGSDNITAVAFEVLPFGDTNFTTRLTTPVRESIFHQYYLEETEERKTVAYSDEDEKTFEDGAADTAHDTLDHIPTSDLQE